MVKKLIVNADDYGRTKNVSNGIRQAHSEGIVSTTTVMMNLPGASEAVQLAKVETPALGLGVHLNLTFGEPLSPESKVTSSTDTQGGFRSKDFYFYHSDKITSNDVEYEWRMQIEALLNCGIVPDHLDSHHHIAMASPELWSLSLRLAKEYGCGVRLPNPTDIPDEVLRNAFPIDTTDFVRHQAPAALDEAGIPYPDHFISSFYGAGVSLDHLMSILHSLPEGISELMCHPGFVDEKLCATSGYAKPRQKEYEILIDPKIGQSIRKSGIVLTTFQQALA